MDLLSLTFRSLELNEITKEESKESHSTSHTDPPKERRRRLHQNKEEPRTFKEDGKNLRTINLDEVAWHDTADNCWLVIYDFVYDCTDFLDGHPGGSDVLLEYAGRDATLAFIGTGHSASARQSLERYLIGELPMEERIFRTPGAVKIAGL